MTSYNLINWIKKHDPTLRLKVEVDMDGIVLLGKVDEKGCREIIAELNLEDN